MKTRKRFPISIQTLLYGCVTGIFCGVIITLFTVCAKTVAAFASGVYTQEHTPLAVVCVLMLVVLCCLITAVVQTLNPPCRGSGIPLAEGMARGMLSVKWLRTAAAIVAGSISAFLCGMPLGSEGPSIGVGGLIGEGVGSIAKKPPAFRRYLITGGSGAGLAVAFNAPLTGVVFSLEETHRKFSPSILLAAFSAVLPAVLVSRLMLWGFEQIEYLHKLGIGAGEAVLSFLAQAGIVSVGDLLALSAAAVLCGIICALVAAAFNSCIFLLGKAFAKVGNPILRLLPVFLLTAICGLCLAQSVGSGEKTFADASVHTAVWLLVALALMRFAMTVLASSSGATGGLFLPMIAIGGLIGLIAAKVAIACGLDSRYAPNIVMLTISAFFAASARAPISSIALAIELTASFANLLPLAVAVAIAVALAGLLRFSPLYERMMENLYSASMKKGEDLTVCGVIPIGSVINGKRISDVLWPHNSLVTELNRGEIAIVPDGETVLHDGDKITVRAENVNKEYFYDQISDYIEHNRN